MEKRKELQALTAELVTAQDQLLALYELSMAMRRQTSIDEALGQLARLTCRTMQAEQCFIQLEAPGRQLIHVQFPDHGEELQESEALLDKEVSFERWVIRDSDKQEDGILILPLNFEDETVGVVSCIRSNGKPFGSPEGKLGQALANQAAAFLENMILNEIRIENAALKAELRVARDVQSSLLPKELPVLREVEIWGSSHPAKHVGGDFFDVQCLPDGSVYFCIGDVSGKGMPAALVMAMLLMLLRSEQKTGGHMGPAALLEYLYRAAYDELTESGLFATLFLGVFDPQTKVLRYANAGHSPVLFREHDGSATLLEAKSVPVGIFAEFQVQEEELTLDNGDVIILASDGLNEASDSSGELFSIERMQQALDANAARSAAEIGNRLLSAVTEFSAGNTQNDDQTCVVIKGSDL